MEEVRLVGGKWGQAGASGQWPNASGFYSPLAKTRKKPEMGGRANQTSGGQARALMHNSSAAYSTCLLYIFAREQ